MQRPEKSIVKYLKHYSELHLKICYTQKSCTSVCWNKNLKLCIFFTKKAGIKSHCHRIFCINNFDGSAADGGTVFIVLILNSRGLDWTASGL